MGTMAEEAFTQSFLRYSAWDMVGTQIIFAESINSLLTLAISFFFLLCYSVLGGRGRHSSIKMSSLLQPGWAHEHLSCGLTRSTKGNPGRVMKELREDSGPR